MNVDVLIIEDSANIRDAMSALLGLRGYQVQVAGNGEEALALLHDGPLPGIILMDLMMPVMDGWAFLEAKERDPRIAAIPVIVNSTVSTFRPLRNRRALVAVLEKPVDMEQLLGVLERYCGRALPRVAVG